MRPERDGQMVGLPKMSGNTEVHGKPGLGKFLNPYMHFYGSYMR